MMKLITIDINACAGIITEAIRENLISRIIDQGLPDLNIKDKNGKSAFDYSYEVSRANKTPNLLSKYMHLKNI